MQATRSIFLAHVDALSAEANTTRETLDQIEERAAALTRADVGNQDWQRFRQSIALQASKDAARGRGSMRQRKEVTRLSTEWLDRVEAGEAVGSIDLRENPDPVGEARSALATGNPVG